MRGARELDEDHRQGPLGPSKPGARPPRGHRRLRPLESPPSNPRSAHLDAPHRVGPGPDAQRHTPGNHTPTARPSRERPPGEPELFGTVGTRHCTNPQHRSPRRRPPQPPRPPPRDINHPPLEVWCTVLEEGHYYVVAATATSPSQQWVIKGTDTMLTQGPPHQGQ